MEQISFHWKGFREIWYLRTFRKSVEKIQFSLRSGKNNGRITLRPIYIYDKGTAVAQWLRYCAANRKVAGSVPDGVMEFFIDIYPSNCTTDLGSNQPLTEMSTRSISRGTCGRCVRLTTLPPSCAVVKKSGNLNFLEPSGSPQPCNGTAFFYIYIHLW
jgi:hypothetical protein